MRKISTSQTNIDPGAYEATHSAGRITAGDSFGGRCLRQLRLSFAMSLRRGAQTPEYSARGVAVGVFWAFTPLMPFQTYLLGLTWIVARKFRSLNFHPLIALAWVFVTNAFNVLPVYFIFYLTGQVLLGQWDDLTGFSAFQEQVITSGDTADSLLGTVKAIVSLVIGPLGVALIVGSFPYALGGALLGYVVSIRMGRRSTKQRTPDPVSANEA